MCSELQTCQQVLRLLISSLEVEGRKNLPSPLALSHRKIFAPTTHPSMSRSFGESLLMVVEGREERARENGSRYHFERHTW